MFNKNNFCHIASNNRNEKKAGVFVYKTSDDLATVATSGYFNDKIIDINLHDLIIHEWHDATDRTKVQKNVLCVVERTLDNVGTVVIKSKWDGDIEQAIADLQTYVDNTFVRKDGTSIMTGPLLMRATDDFKCAIAPYWDGVGFFKLNSDDSVTLLASMEETDGLCPAANNTYNIGKTNYKWKDLYLGGTAYIPTINNGVNLTVPTPASADTLAVLSDIAFKSTDVELTSPASGQFLMYNGTKWINSTQGYANTDLSNLTATGEAKFTAKADDNAVVHLSGTEIITGEKTFNTAPRLKNNLTPSTITTKVNPIEDVLLAESENTDGNPDGVRITRYQRTSGSREIHISGGFRDSSDSSNLWPRIRIGVQSNDTKYISLEDVDLALSGASDANNSIVTTTGISKGDIGYVKLGNGIIIQWGVTAAQYSTDPFNITFPTAFTHGTMGLVGQFTKANCGQFPRVDSSTTTTAQFTIDNLSTGAVVSNQRIRWIAIGY